jgi:hypothetical protein
LTLLELDAGPGPELKFLIGPLDREGNTLHSYVLGNPRMIDVRPGYTVQHARGRWKVLGVKAWRETYFPDGESAAADRYLVQPWVCGSA